MRSEHEQSDEEAREKDAANRCMDKCLAALSKHFASIRLFGTKLVDGGEMSIRATRGHGCHYSQLAVCREWVIEQDQHVRTHADMEQRGEFKDDD